MIEEAGEVGRSQIMETLVCIVSVDFILGVVWGH